MKVKELMECLQHQNGHDVVKVIGAYGESIDIDTVYRDDLGIVCIELDGVTRLTGSDVEPL